jgi:hypothetical protein
MSAPPKALGACAAPMASPRIVGTLLGALAALLLGVTGWWFNRRRRRKAVALALFFEVKFLRLDWIGAWLKGRRPELKSSQVTSRARPARRAMSGAASSGPAGDALESGVRTSTPGPARPVRSSWTRRISGPGQATARQTPRERRRRGREEPQPQAALGEAVGVRVSGRERNPGVREVPSSASVAGVS